MLLVIISNIDKYVKAVLDLGVSQNRQRFDAEFTYILRRAVNAFIYTKLMLGSYIFARLANPANLEPKLVFRGIRHRKNILGRMIIHIRFCQSIIKSLPQRG